MKCGLAWLLAFLPWMGFADEGGSAELLERIRNGGEAKFRYEETRTLELASSPWHGQGYMLSDTGGILVKLQLKPTRVVMAITDQHMYYWDPEQQQRHSAPLKSGGPAAKQITVFRSILQGRVEDLQSAYVVSSEKQGKRWALSLTPKAGTGDQDAPSIEMSGNEDDSERRIRISQPDGESTEYRMVKTMENQAQEYTVPRLMQEVIGER